MYKVFSQKKCSRPVYLLLFCLPFFSCQSEGQTNQDESEYSHRREIPSYILEKLPDSVDTLAQNEFFIFVGHGKIEQEQIDAINLKSAVLAQQLLKINPSKKTISPIFWHLYPSSETKGLLLNNSSALHIDKQKKEIHSVANSIFELHYIAEGFPLLIRQLYGEAHISKLEIGLSIWTDPAWQKIGFRNWGARLAAAHTLPSIKDILAHEKWADSSPLIYGTAAACVVDFFMEKYGATVFFENYTSWSPNKNELGYLEKEWQLYIEEIKENYTTEKNDKNILPYLKGFNFAHEGYRIFNGYGSQKAKQSLIHQKNMGANSMAIVPYTFMQNGTQVSAIPVIKRAGMENEESIITSSEHAQNLNLQVVLKPQIWLGNNQWPGEIEMNSEKEWKQFFKHYRHWIFHHAILAEIYNWEVLCIGTEMVKTTLKRKKDWINLVEDIRKIYGGQLTYAANWGEEFENTEIWSTLDFIGINCYYPLSQQDEASDEELEAAFGEVMKKIERVHRKYKKPVVFTEIGFPSLYAPWKKPHEDWGDFEENQKHQERCYEIVFKCIKNKQWCNGILWWKYPSDTEYEPRRKTGFTPHNKLAEHTVEKWFKRKGE